MANHKSAIKRHHQSIRRHLRNQSVQSSVKTLIKKVKATIDGKNPEAIAAKIREVNGMLDKAVVKGSSNAIPRRESSPGWLGPAHQALTPEAPVETAPET